MLRLRILLLALIGTASCLAASGQGAYAGAGFRGPGSSGQSNTLSSDANEKALYSFLTAWRYRFFIEFVGRENTILDRERFPRTDYESAIVIGDGEEQAMLEIVLSASQKMIKTWDQIDARTLELLEDHAQIEQINSDPNLKNLSDQQTEIVKETMASLRRDIGDEALKKVDSYVFREFINRKGPLSLWRSEASEIESTASDPDPGSSETAKMSARRRYAFADFFQISGGMLKRSSQPASVREDAGGALPACTPSKDRLAAQEIIVNIDDQMLLIKAREDADIGQYHKDFGPGPIPRPLPNALETEQGRFWAAADLGINDLKRRLGDAEFAKFERAVVDAFGPGLWKEASQRPQLAAARP